MPDNPHAGLDADLDLAAEAALAGAEVARAAFGGPLQVRDKSPGNPVTDADLAVDARLRDILRTARPDYGWLSEETADDASRLAARRTWVVDPIDGTRAFIKGRPAFTVCVGLVEGGVALAGAVCNPVTGELWTARAGGGARRNGASVSAGRRDRVEDCRMLGDAAMFRHPAWPQPWPAMQVEARNSIALRMCLVADGAFDGAIALSAKMDWDLAAATVIVSEAGGLATDHEGRPFRFDGADPRQRSLITAGKSLHPLLIERVRHVRLP